MRRALACTGVSSECVMAALPPGPPPFVSASFSHWVCIHNPYPSHQIPFPILGSTWVTMYLPFSNYSLCMYTIYHLAVCFSLFDFTSNLLEEKPTPIVRDGSSSQPHSHRGRQAFFLPHLLSSFFSLLFLLESDGCS